jgi:hypothetical protein
MAWILVPTHADTPALALKVAEVFAQAAPG